MERDLPIVKCTGPVMVEQVRRSVSRCTVSSCSMPTSDPACSTVLPSNHLGGRTDGMEVSHSNQAGAGSITVMSCRPRTMVMDCSVGKGPVTASLVGGPQVAPLPESVSSCAQTLCLHQGPHLPTSTCASDTPN